MTKPPERKPPFYLLTGLLIGLMFGLVINIASPAKRSNLTPATLSDEYKDQYRLMTALAYASSSNIGRAKARLAWLGDNDPVRALASQAQLSLADSKSQRQARALASLAEDLQSFLDSAQSTSVAVNTPDPSQQGAQATPFAETAENASYIMKSQELLCKSSDTPPLVKLFVFDAKDNAQAGVKLTIASSQGTEEFYTGAHPEQGPGYAEYELSPGVQYTLSVQGTALVGGLQAAACETDAGDSAWGSWLFIFNAQN